MSRIPTGTAWPSNSSIAAASRDASGTPRGRIPTSPTSSPPPLRHSPLPPPPPNMKHPPRRSDGRASSSLRMLRSSLDRTHLPPAVSPCRPRGTALKVRQETQVCCPPYASTHIPSLQPHLCTPQRPPPP